MSVPFTKKEEAVAAGIERVGSKVKDRVLDTGRKAGLGWLDLYEKTLRSTADLQQSVGEASNVDAFSKIASAQAAFTRDMAETYTSAGRNLLKSK